MKAHEILQAVGFGHVPFLSGPRLPGGGRWL
jgi:hypothetical protein